MVEQFKPIICIAGHMHEHFGSIMIDDTPCINTGFGPEINTMLNIVDGKIKSIEFYPEIYGHGKTYK